ncbi:hypothetical protein RRG08_018734, partial [Elysia crispata]
EVPSIDD